MITRDTNLKGAFVIEPERFEDARGFFARVVRRRVHGRSARGPIHRSQLLVQSQTRDPTRTALAGRATLPSQARRCTRGSVFDVGVDLRPDSETYGKWMSIELSDQNRLMLYVPEGFAHGYLTLEDESEVLYLVTNGYAPESGCGIRWNDPAFGIRWPDVGELIVNDRDQNYPDFRL